MPSLKFSDQLINWTMPQLKAWRDSCHKNHEYDTYFELVCMEINNRDDLNRYIETAIHSEDHLDAVRENLIK